MKQNFVRKKTSETRAVKHTKENLLAKKGETKMPTETALKAVLELTLKISGDSAEEFTKNPELIDKVSNSQRETNDCH